MKYIVLPILKAVWGVVLTILISLVTVITGIILTLWDLELNLGWAFDEVELSWIDVGHASPYAMKPTEAHEITKIYKTYYHYIWNIQ